MSNAEASSSGRTINIDIGAGEEVGIDLDDLDLNVEDLLEVIKDSRCSPWVWTTLALEYWKKGHADKAETIAQTAIESAQDSAGSKPIHAFLANLQMANARRAPKLILPDPHQDDMRSEKPKGHYHNEAAIHLNKSTSSDADRRTQLLSFLTRGIHQLGTRSMDDALRSFESVLAAQPTNVVALLGKARIYYVRRQFKESLRLFQRVLELNPSCRPDPRVGIGMCLWQLDHKAKAKAAWQRSLEVNPTEWSAALLLGLEAINASKDELKHPDAERIHLFVTGTKYVESAFKGSNQRAAAAANVLCDVFLRKGAYDRAMKLAERTIQYADTLSVLTEGYIHAGRVSHAKGDVANATKYFETATKEPHPKTVLASVGLAQMHVKKGESQEYAAAIHTLDTLLSPPNAPNSVEATAMLASLRAHPRPGISSSDAAHEKTKARELYEKVYKMLGLSDVSRTNGSLNGTGLSLNRSQRRVADDVDMHAEIARLWQTESLERTGRALREALRRNEAQHAQGQQDGQVDVDPRLLNNLGVLSHLDGAHVEARELYEQALTGASTLQGEVGEGMATSVLYNLARCYEDQGEQGMATEAYKKLLARHPEYVDAKIRQAAMLSDLNEKNEAHDLIKQALSSQNGNLNLRAFYTHFLIEAGMYKPAKDFLYNTIKDFDRHDVHALCATAHIHYHQARESRDSSSQGIAERRKGFQRAAGFYENALSVDPMCAVAAQGLAIVTAEDALGTLNGALQPGAPAPDPLKRATDLRDALEIFSKVRETLYDGSVYMNIGHCHYARDEYDRAIESYETASRRFYDNHNVAALLCLCRSWYAKANKELSFTAMNTALKYAQNALYLNPHDKAIVYNIAMIQQKAAELLFSIPPAKRSLADLEKAIGQATHAQKMFASLASDKSTPLPYNIEIADQRRRYGESMLRRGEEHLATQRQYESEHRAKLDAARQRRMEERQRQEAMERERAQELEVAAKRLAEERRLAREQALEWSREVKMESDEEKEKKAKRAIRRVKTEGGASGDETEPKKKRRTKTRKGGAAEDGEEEEALFSGEEDDSKPPRKRQRNNKTVVKDEDDDGPAPGAVGKSRKVFKSKEIIEDSDEEMA
ncbi:TPR-like protein [Punctularia strigosozonata HHB-11173 SS5]|uniref:TPR-like protein n=1 Tax=Punctularia strigosozonata (strain HHB-11173) TaxID=741275 RepID=UPI0004417980|nr:TPR-like protein [Punctularia strigosozonata HHB-11173 SS5]EIN11558.1 TPR-like protein [Punctularia strigosozonata HHB-11173 SS5]